MEEVEIENKLIHDLIGENQWTYCPEINSVDKLWANLRDILNKNNIANLNEIPLTDKEFELIKTELTFATNFDAAKFLVGQNGVAHVNLKRDGKTIPLILFVRNQRFGTNVYQVVHQVQILKAPGMEKDRRFDVTLLINGLPLIQIELKQQSVSENDAYEQIKKYESEGCYRDIFRFVQLFVVSNASVTKYFAAGTYEDIAKTHLSSWRDDKNNVITNLDDFTTLVLKRPMAYDMITRYTVLEEDKNNGRKRLITLRPYQIHAIKAIESASKAGRSGYVWHTTGSGKTLTSYKAARNLVNDIPSINKTIFLVDRKDLDNQTATAFLAYSENDLVDVDKTSNTYELIKKLYNNDEQVIVTTIQKLNLLIKDLMEQKEEGKTKFYDVIKNKRIAFVVDECHRTIPPERMAEVRKFFQNCLWYGFTGTPRFEENAYPNNGYARTTDELYGKLNNHDNKECCLHKYTIENAIKDGAVLGFNVKYMTADCDEENPWTEVHMLNVIKNIITTWNIHGLQNGVGNTFESLLTVPNIKVAQKYYELFKKVKNGAYADKGIYVSKRIKEVLPDFPKFAISYSVQDDNDNTDKLDYNQMKMDESIEDYNEMFDTKFSVNEIDSYNLDLQNRMKRVGKRFESRSQQLDLVIVVNRLLTGFDAIPLANLFVDRQPTELHSIIQMFSRTNRIAPKMHKEYGNIITYQSPDLWQAKVREAISLFTNGGEKYAIARDYSEVKKDYLDKYRYLESFKIRHPNLDEIEVLDEKEQKEFAKNVQAYDRLRKELKTYVDYVNDAPVETETMEEAIVQEETKTQELQDLTMQTVAEDRIPEIDDEVFDQMRGHYNSLIKKFKKEDNFKIEEGFDFDYNLEVYDIDKINLEYIAVLMDNFKGNPNKKLEDDIINYILKVKEYNPKLGDILQEYFNQIKEHPEQYTGRSSLNVINEMKSKIMKEQCEKFAREYHLDFETLYYSASKYNSRTENPEDIDEIQTIVKDASIEGVMPFKAKKIIKQRIKEMFDEEILPLNNVE